MWKIIRLVWKHKEIKDLLVTLAQAISDGKLTKDEQKELVNKVAAVITSYL